MSLDALLAGPENSGAALARSWACGKSSGGSHANLKQMHVQFNRKFGSPKLHMGRDQCYVLKCYDHYFGVCNAAGRDAWEISGD
ncbi:hypothetical protein GX50_08656 [[Emmonsia] crescens]|uniref:Uncharacterized protein n=1 Tax=[Emmonsia] crescens TaxID=73230 RepID=A0A2B7Z3X4_9EURO|nr:hypothetical protein GX50_08656 [Emmonsia crescens]